MSNENSSPTPPTAPPTQAQAKSPGMFTRASDAVFEAADSHPISSAVLTAAGGAALYDKGGSAVGWAYDKARGVFGGASSSVAANATEETAKGFLAAAVKGVFGM